MNWQAESNYTAHLVCPLNKLAHGLALPPCQELEPDEVTYLLGVRYGLKDPKDALKAETINN